MRLLTRIRYSPIDRLWRARTEFKGVARSATDRSRDAAINVLITQLRRAGLRHGVLEFQYGPGCDLA